MLLCRQSDATGQSKAEDQSSSDNTDGASQSKPGTDTSTAEDKATTKPPPFVRNMSTQVRGAGRNLIALLTCHDITAVLFVMFL